MALRLRRKLEKSTEGSNLYESLKFTDLEARYGKEKATKIAKKKVKQGMVLADPELPDDEDWIENGSEYSTCSLTYAKDHPSTYAFEFWTELSSTHCLLKFELLSRVLGRCSLQCSPHMFPLRKSNFTLSTSAHALSPRIA